MSISSDGELKTLLAVERRTCSNERDQGQSKDFFKIENPLKESIVEEIKIENNAKNTIKERLNIQLIKNKELKLTSHNDNIKALKKE